MDAISMPRARGLGLPGSRRMLGAFSDERLVAAVRAGNERAFEVLYDRHQRGVLGFCRHMLGSVDEAEDAVQQAFLSAHRDMLRDEKDIRFKAWLYTIARNRCLSILRARREQSSEDIEISVDRLSEDVSQRADLKDLLHDIAELPDRQRAALVLSEVADLSHAEVADVVECEVSQVKSLVFQARSSLIDRRNARDMPCEEIREELATLKGGSLRRSHLRHHLNGCPGCAAFREDVKRQRQMLAIALPVFPSLGLKDSVLASIGLGGGAGGAGAAGGAIAAKGGFGLAAHGLAAKAAVVAVVAGGAAGGGAVVMEARDGGAATPATAVVAPSALAAGGGGAGGAGAAAGTETENGEGGDASSKRKGFTPVKGESNGERAREFAATRGRGRHKGLTKAQRVTRAKAQKLRAERARRRQVRQRRSEERAAQPPERTVPRERPQNTGPVAPAPERPEPEPEPVEPEPEPEPIAPAPELPQSAAGKPLKLK